MTFSIRWIPAKLHWLVDPFISNLELPRLKIRIKKSQDKIPNVQLYTKPKLKKSQYSLYGCSWSEHKLYRFVLGVRNTTDNYLISYNIRAFVTWTQNLKYISIKKNLFVRTYHSIMHYICTRYKKFQPTIGKSRSVQIQ